MENLSKQPLAPNLVTQRISFHSDLPTSYPTIAVSMLMTLLWTKNCVTGEVLARSAQRRAFPIKLAKLKCHFSAGASAECVRFFDRRSSGDRRCRRKRMRCPQPS
jgi:hypothetical protein